jgi:hypothetical protein
LVQPEVSDQRAVRNQILNAIVTVIGNDQFFAGVILTHEISDRLGNKPSSVGRRHDTGGQRLIPGASPGSGVVVCWVHFYEI